jgi:hypothetical protein
MSSQTLRVRSESKRQIFRQAEMPFDFSVEQTELLLQRPVTMRRQGLHPTEPRIESMHHTRQCKAGRNSDEWHDPQRGLRVALDSVPLAAPHRRMSCGMRGITGVQPLRPVGG